MPPSATIRSASAPVAVVDVATAPVERSEESAPPPPSVRTRSNPLAALGWMVLACALFAVMNLGAKRALRELPWHEVAAGRSIFGALTIWLIARARGRPLVVHDRKTQWVRTIAGIGGMCCGFFALSRLSMGDAVTLSALSPLLVAIASRRVLRERSGGGLGASVALGFVGVIILVGVHLQSDRGALVGVIFGLVAAVFSAVAMLYLRRLGPRESSEGVSLHFLGVAAVALLVIGAGRQVVPSTDALLSLAVAGLTGGVAQLLMTKAYGLDKAARVGGIGYSGIVMSQILGTLVLHEVPTVRQVCGAMLVILSGVVLVSTGLREKKTA